MDNQGIGQRPSFGLKDRGDCQRLKGIGSQAIDRFGRNPGNPAGLKQGGTFGHPLLSGHNAGASVHGIVVEPPV